MSLMKRHQQNHGKELGVMPATSVASIPSTQTASVGLMGGVKLAELVSAALTEDLATLKGIASHERKADLKRDQLIPKYRDYVRRLREAGIAHEVTGWYLVWLMDSGLIEEGLYHALDCLSTDQSLPENFKASVEFFTSDKLLTWAENEFSAERSFEPYVTLWLDMVQASPHVWNVHDSLMARYYRLSGLVAEKEGRLEDARTQLHHALVLGAKVKTALDGVVKKLEKSAPQSEEQPETQSEEQPETQTDSE